VVMNDLAETFARADRAHVAALPAILHWAARPRWAPGPVLRARTPPAADGSEPRSYTQAYGPRPRRALPRAKPERCRGSRLKRSMAYNCDRSKNQRRKCELGRCKRGVKL
jgi:hypothetical protein